MSAINSKLSVKVFTRFFLLIAVPAIGLTLAAAMFLWSYFKDAEYDLLQSQAEDRVVLYETQVAHELASAINDFHYILNSGYTRKFISGANVEIVNELEEGFSHFLKSKPNLFQVRIIGLDGREIQRLQKNADGVHVARDDDLQDKSDRYYFTRALALDPSEYYVSALDLNVENGEFTYPLQPTLRFAAPLFAADGMRKGVLVVNFDASSLMQSYSMARSDGHPGVGLMVNERGNWLRGIEPKDDWAHILGHSRSFANDFPMAWEVIEKAESGTVRSHGGIIAFKHISPNEMPQDVSDDARKVKIVFRDQLATGHWVLMHYIAPQEIDSAMAPLKSAGTKITSLLVMLILGGASSLSYLNFKRRESSEQVKSVQKGLLNAQRMSGMGSWTWDMSGRDVVWSDNVYQIFGLKRDRFKPTLESLMPLIHPDDEEFVRSAFRYSIETLRPLIVEHRILRPDGTVRSVIQRGEIISDDKRAPIRFEGVVQDITDRKRFEEMLRIAKDEAEAATVTKARFLANMSHEIRTPMNGVVGMLELLRDTPLDATQKNYVATALGSANMQMSVINDILDFSKIESGHLELENIEFDVATLIEDMCHMLAPQVSAKGVDLWCFVTPKLRNFVIGDPMRLQQIIANLLGNAIKFTHEGEIDINCNIANEDNVSLELRIEVEDSGVGIPISVQENLFDPFSQADTSTTRRFGGSGLGLAICRELVESMGGHIHLQSEEGRGSLFWFEVKFEKSSFMIDESQALLPGKNVLVVDSNVKRRAMYEEYLKDWGVGVIVLPTAAAALGCLELQADDASFDMIIIDDHMTDMAGIALAENIKKTYGENTPPICLCSSGEPFDASRLKAAGVTHTFMNPIRRSEIKNSLLGLTDELDEGLKSGDKSGGVVRQYDAKVLVVEDTFVNQQVIRGLLGATGVTIDMANNGREGVEKYKAGHYDLIFMDVQMPEMDGYQATKAIRAHEESTSQHIPIVAMTAHAMAGDREKCLAAGMDDYLSKPVKRKSVEDSLFSWLSDRVVKVSAKAMPQGPSSSHHSIPHADNVDEPAIQGIDPAVFEELRVNLSSVPDGLQDVVADYKLTACEQMTSIKTGFKSEDFEAVFRAAHSLKSNSATLGAMALSVVARDIELKGRNGEVDGLDALINRAEELWAVVDGDISKLNIDA